MKFPNIPNVLPTAGMAEIHPRPTAGGVSDSAANFARSPGCTAMKGNEGTWRSRHRAMLHGVGWPDSQPGFLLVERQREVLHKGVFYPPPRVSVLSEESSDKRVHSPFIPRTLDAPCSSEKSISPSSLTQAASFPLCSTSQVPSEQKQKESPFVPICKQDHAPKCPQLLMTACPLGGFGVTPAV